MSVLRDFPSYVIYCVLACGVGMGVGLIFHDFSAAFHRAQRHGKRSTCVARVDTNVDAAR